MELTDRIAVVTGGTSGIGAAVARDLRHGGARVVTWDVNSSADAVCDIADPSSVEAAMRWTLREVGVPSVWVMSAGINGRAPFIDTPLEDWDRIFSVNVRGTYVCMREAARAMIDAGIDGSMVLLSSTSGTLSDPASVPYSVSKAAVIHLAKVAAVELGPHRIRVNAVAPGPTYTPMTARNLDHDEYRQLVIDTTPLGEVGTPDLLSNGVIGLLTMDWVTGQLLVVDGGTSLVTPRGAKRASYGAFRAGHKYSGI